MARRREARHVRTDLRQQHLSGRSAHARDRVQSAQLVVKWLQPLGDFGVQLGDVLVQEVDVGYLGAC